MWETDYSGLKLKILNCTVAFGRDQYKLDICFGMRTVYPCKLNEVFSWEFPVDHQGQYTPDEDWKAQ